MEDADVKADVPRGGLLPSNGLLVVAALIVTGVEISAKGIAPWL